MSIWEAFFGHPVIRQLPPNTRNEVKGLLDDLVEIGRLDDYLSLTPGSPFDGHCHHTGARRIGERLNEIGGLPLMHAARSHVNRKLKAVMAEHLDHCWKGIGDWTH